MLGTVVTVNGKKKTDERRNVREETKLCSLQCVHTECGDVDVSTVSRRCRAPSLQHQARATGQPPSTILQSSPVEDVVRAWWGCRWQEGGEVMSNMYSVHWISGATICLVLISSRSTCERSVHCVCRRWLTTLLYGRSASDAPAAGGSYH